MKHTTTIIIIFSILTLIVGCGRATQAVAPSSQPTRVQITAQPTRVQITAQPTSLAASASLPGTWIAKFQYSNTLLYLLYRFNDDGSLNERILDEQARTIVDGRGTYIFTNGKVVINWIPSGEEIATVVWIDANTFRYTITAHTDQQQVGSIFEFYRVNPRLPFPDVNPQRESPSPTTKSQAPAQSDSLPKISGIPGPNRDGSYGPFATIRRAREVAAMFVQMGYPNTIYYHNGDGEYVFPRR